MTKKQEFIEFVKDYMAECKDEMSENVRLYWEAFCNTQENEKPAFTDNGKLILKFLQDNQQTAMWKAKDIGEGLFISSRMVSGAMRKLVTDGYVEKVGENPVIYSLTENGKNIEIE
jgi:DNA-binding MarR family transcriptional regulator